MLALKRYSGFNVFGIFSLVDKTLRLYIFFEKSFTLYLGAHSIGELIHFSISLNMHIPQETVHANDA